MSNLKRNREYAARQLLAAGLNDEEVAEALGLSPVTVRKYVDPAFAAVLAAHNQRLRRAEKEHRNAAKAERVAAIMNEFLSAAADANCQLPPLDSEEFTQIFTEWRNRSRRKSR